MVLAHNYNAASHRCGRKRLVAAIQLCATMSSAGAIMVGPNSFLNDTINYYAGKPCFNGNYRPIDALTQYIPAATAVTGVPDVASNDTSGVAAAAAAAANADLVILAIGSDLMLEREGHDRTSIAVRRTRRDEGSGAHVRLPCMNAHPRRCPPAGCSSLTASWRSSLPWLLPPRALSSRGSSPAV